MPLISRLRLRLQSALIGGFLATNAVALAAPTGSAHFRGWQDLLTNKVIACGAAALGLFLVSLVLKGIVKLISLVVVVVLALGAFWFVRDAWSHRAELLPREWNALADKSLQSPKAQAAWQSVQSELSHLSAEARARLSAGTDDARKSLSAMLESKATEMRKAGSKAEAEELLRLRELFATKR